jgi:hypothetical protein
MKTRIAEKASKKGNDANEAAVEAMPMFAHNIQNLIRFSKLEL